ncbi:hypothetical protein [Desulfobulbus alkaliphilus]|uniref:hypothetical protein n=1 Tax=Desulfobulbus alkaliphilus TaxID=869814 RepID=UPI0030841366
MHDRNPHLSESHHYPRLYRLHQEVHRRVFSRRPHGYLPADLSCLGLAASQWPTQGHGLPKPSPCTRFIILPWVSDWQQLYNHPIVWIETFIDTERFTGTSYRAANWIKLGLTHGRGKYNKPSNNSPRSRPCRANPYLATSVKGSLMDRQEAERINAEGREVVIATLLAMDTRIRELEEYEQRVGSLEGKIAALTSNSTNSSRPPSTDPPGTKKNLPRRTPDLTDGLTFKLRKKRQHCQVFTEKPKNLVTARNDNSEGISMFLCVLPNMTTQYFTNANTPSLEFDVWCS